MQIVKAGFVRLVPKLPAWVPAPEICAVALGGVLVLIGGAILAGYKTRLAAFSLAGLLLILFGFRTPELAANSGALANPTKILALLGGALLVGSRGEKETWIASVLFAIFF